MLRIAGRNLFTIEQLYSFCPVGLPEGFKLIGIDLDEECFCLLREEIGGDFSPPVQGFMPILCPSASI